MGLHGKVGPNQDPLHLGVVPVKVFLFKVFKVVLGIKGNPGVFHETGAVLVMIWDIAELKRR